MKKWTISLISTFEDMRDLRNTLARNIEEIGFEVLAFERSGYPIEPRVSADEACLATLKHADIVILIIDRRYGGKLFLGSDVSITEKEYQEACGLEKIVIPCVSTRAEDERKTLNSVVRRKMDETGLNVEQARSLIGKPSYVEDWKVLDFIDKVASKDKDNFITFFEDSGDLIARLKGRLEGLTPHICRRIMKSQASGLRSTRSAVSPLSYNDIIRDGGCFIEPPFTVLSGVLNEQSAASSICDLSANDGSVMIIGEPGIGKSILLARTFLQHVNSVKETTMRIPFFFSLRGKIGFSFEFKDFIKESAENNLGKEMFPSFREELVDPVFYLDGFDEIAEQFLEEELLQIGRSYIFSRPFVVSCRRAFYDTQLEPIAFPVNNIIELSGWDKESMLSYVKRSQKSDWTKDLPNRIVRVHDEMPELRQVLENPLLLTMLLFLAANGSVDLPPEIADKTAMYDLFIERWAKRETMGIETDSVSDHISKLKKCWEVASWEIYKARFSGESITLDQMQERLQNSTSQARDIVGSRAFISLIDYNSRTRTIQGMLHEQLMEHLLARCIVNSSCQGYYPFPDYLHYEVRYEVKQLIRALWGRETAKNLQQAKTNIWEGYKSSLKDGSSKSVKSRNQAMYYLGRMPILDHEKRAILVEALNLETEVHVILSIMFGLIRMGDIDAESILYDKLTGEPSWDSANRGNHLVHYGDWVLRDEKPPFEDDGKRDWLRAHKVLMRHFQSKEPKHVFLRRIELLTVRRLIQVRDKTSPLSVDDLEVIRGSIGDLVTSNYELAGKAMAEYDALESVFKGLQQ
jgi:hypothetical protein